MHEQAENAVKKVTANSTQDAAMKKAIIAQYGEASQLFQSVSISTLPDLTNIFSFFQVADVGTDDDEGETEDGEGAISAQKLAGLVVSAKPDGSAALGHDKVKEKKDGSSMNLLTRNTNAELVTKAEKEKRENAKAEAEKKKQLDKLNK